MIKKRCPTTTTVNCEIQLNKEGAIHNIGYVDKDQEIFEDKAVGAVPLYLERRSHDIFVKLVGKKIPITGFISLTFDTKNNLINAQLTPANQPVLFALMREITFLEGRLHQLERQLGYPSL